MFPEHIVAEAHRVIDAARASGTTITAVESCTAGLVSAALTAVSGSSRVVDRGFVTYSNDAKSELVGVDPSLIERFGAVSEEVARAMAEGALARSHADLSVSITGVAGPTGGSPEKPVGTVWFATARRGGPTLARLERFGDLGREGVRLAAVETALFMLAGRIG